MPDDGDAPRLVARLVSLDPQDDNATNVQDWIDAAQGAVFPGGAQNSDALTTAFGTMAFGTSVTNSTGVDLLVSGSCIVTSATAGLVNLGVSAGVSPTVSPITPAITVAAATVVSFAALVPSGYTIELTHSGTITVGSPVVIATALNGGTAS